MKGRPYIGPVDDDAPLDDLEQLFVDTMVSALLKVIRSQEAAARNAATDGETGGGAAAAPAFSAPTVPEASGE